MIPGRSRMTRECHVRFFEKGVIPPPIRPDERSTELHPYSPGPCTLFFPGGWPPILDLPIFKKIPGSIWFSIKIDLIRTRLLLRGDTDSTRSYPTPGHHSMSGRRGDILDVWERSWSGKAKTAPRIWVARGRLCPDGGALWGRAQPNRDSTPPASSAPLYRLNNSFGLVGGTGEPRELACLDIRFPPEDQVGEPCDGKPSRTADKAATKAMLVNRVGDFGLALGISGRFTLFQTVDFSTIFARASAPRNSWISCNMRLNAISLICILLLIGAVGKSAQIGSHTWSPDAMEGPTPVSASIHAATMVTAGVFMIARCSPLFEYPPTALIVITSAGATTSFLAATTGILQNDLKRVIAYSTCSQLGYMIFACGISNYSVSVFHLMNHAFFKALLFLSAGSVIHAMSDEQDMRKMGGLASSFPLTYAMMLIGSLSLIGFPFLTGFYSKDVILELAYTKYTISGNFAFWLGSISVLFTSYYSFRLLFLTFLVPTNSFGRDISRCHDAPIPMAIPSILLALGVSL
ncbi:NADH:quinone oxidoreductase/Mrp antiporter membrane subunit (mitochondrion) [Arabidopsis suecica]|uniref:NADH:quinone oxidoreductase/Mrp antiporter membrane subunit n=1 Tax=Arabidopsis suecica TaxID=45249 RepID=A0A8T1XEW2_ARASU|nr:NADH:quinone oxidoreductase/Mrp antiporter membrane subunit [Arabidopsis suecica]